MSGKFECSVHGLVDVTLKSGLIERLEGICRKKEDFSEHEITFIPTAGSRHLLDFFFSLSDTNPRTTWAMDRH